MTTMSVTSKGQVTIPKRVRQLLGIGPGSKLAFDVEGADVRIRLVQPEAKSRIEDGPAILKYAGPRIPVSEMHGGAAIRGLRSKLRVPTK